MLGPLGLRGLASVETNPASAHIVRGLHGERGPAFVTVATHLRGGDEAGRGVEVKLAMGVALPVGLKNVDQLLVVLFVLDESAGHNRFPGTSLGLGPGVAGAKGGNRLGGGQLAACEEHADHGPPAVAGDRPTLADWRRGGDVLEGV